MSNEDVETDAIARYVVITVFMVLGATGNGIVLKIYMSYKKSQKHASHVYIIILAWLDLISCCVIMPQMPFARTGRVPLQVIASEFTFHLQSYVFVQVAMVLDRFFAVFYPLKFHQIRKKTNIALLIAFIVFQTITQLLIFLTDIAIFTIPLFGVCALGIVTTLVTYPAIAIRLWRHNQTLNLNENEKIYTMAMTSRHLKVLNEKQLRTTQHVKTLKLYVAVLTLYLASFIPLIIEMLTYGAGIGLIYLYYLNNVCNPLIYYIFISKFRRDVKALFKTCVCKTSCKQFRK